MTWPAEEPGTPQRWMATHDRIRLTGLLRKKPWQRGFFYACYSPGTRQARPAADVTAVSVEPPGTVARRGLGSRASYAPLRAVNPNTGSSVSGQWRTSTATSSTMRRTGWSSSPLPPRNLPRRTRRKNPETPTLRRAGRIGRVVDAAVAGGGGGVEPPIASQRATRARPTLAGPQNGSQRSAPLGTRYVI